MLICAFVVCIWHKQIFHDVAQITIIQRNNKMKFIRNRSRYRECHRPRIYNDDILSSNICIPLLSVFLSKKGKKEQKNKRNRKINTQKNCIDRPGIEPGTSRSPVLHFTTALMHTLKNYYRKSLLKQW